MAAICARSKPRTLRLPLAAAVLITGSLTGLGIGEAAAAPSASKSVGSITCDASGGLSFNPPLSPDGSSGRQEKIVLTEHLTKCTGKPNTHVPARSQSVITKPIDLSPTPNPTGKKVVGDCQMLAEQLSQASISQTIKWGGIYRTQGFTYVSRLMEEEGIYYFFFHTHGAHPLQLALGLSSINSRALQTCVNGSGPPIDRLAIAPTLSWLTEGATVLTTHKLDGTNVAVGDEVTASLLGGPTCTSAQAEMSVGFNPAIPGTATLQLTGMTFAGCTIDMGASVGDLQASVVAEGLPQPVSIGDASGDPVTLGGLSLVFSVDAGASTCVYASSGALSASYYNSTDSITGFGFSSLTYTGGTGPLSSACPSDPLEVPSFFSVRDSSQPGSPVVFDN